MRLAGARGRAAGEVKEEAAELPPGSGLAADDEEWPATMMLGGDRGSKCGGAMQDGEGVSASGVELEWWRR